MKYVMEGIHAELLIKKSFWGSKKYLCLNTIGIYEMDAELSSAQGCKDNKFIPEKKVIDIGYKMKIASQIPFDDVIINDQVSDMSPILFETAQIIGYDVQNDILIFNLNNEGHVLILDLESSDLDESAKAAFRSTTYLSTLLKN